MRWTWAHADSGVTRRVDQTTCGPAPPEDGRRSGPGMQSTGWRDQRKPQLALVLPVPVHLPDSNDEADHAPPAVRVAPVGGEPAGAPGAVVGTWTCRRSRKSRTVQLPQLEVLPRKVWLSRPLLTRQPALGCPDRRSARNRSTSARSQRRWPPGVRYRAGSLPSSDHLARVSRSTPTRRATRWAPSSSSSEAGDARLGGCAGRGAAVPRAPQRGSVDSAGDRPGSETTRSHQCRPTG